MTDARGGASRRSGKSPATRSQNRPTSAPLRGRGKLKSTPQTTSTTGGFLKRTRSFIRALARIPGAPIRDEESESGGGYHGKWQVDWPSRTLGRQEMLRMCSL